MPMYWAFNCFLGCIYTVYCIVYIVVLVLNWLSNLEFWLPKKEDQVARIGVMGGGGFRWFGQCPKENVFLPLTPSLKLPWNHGWYLQISIHQSIVLLGFLDIENFKVVMMIRQETHIYANARAKATIQFEKQFCTSFHQTSPAPGPCCLAAAWEGFLK